jgi:hypothetical protein
VFIFIATSKNTTQSRRATETAQRLFQVTVLPAGWAFFASAATATTKTSATTATTAIATEAAATATASIASILAWASRVDSEVPSVQILSVELLNCPLTFFIRRHFDEAEASRSSCVAILDHRC